MKLVEAIDKLEALNDEATIYASEPWNEDSIAITVPEPDDGGLPEEAKRLGLRYFLEVFLAREFLEDWVAGLGAEPSSKEKCARVIQYAIKDA